MIQWLKSLLFIVLSYGMMLPLAIVFLPWAIFDRRGALAACHSWCAFTLWLVRVLCGVKTEVRGTPPTDEVLIAAKHQSFLDIIMIYHAVPRGKFIMKKELLWAPILGQYALMIGCVPVDRGKRAEAVRKMVADVAAGRQQPGQLIIYPQGTRIPPGVQAPYKVGSSILYGELEQPCVPVACNVGLFWPKRGILRTPGTAVVEFLDPIPPGMEQRAFLEELERRVEDRSNELMREGGLPLPVPAPPVEEEKGTPV